MHPLVTPTGEETRWAFHDALPRSYFFSVGQAGTEPAGLARISLPAGNLFVSPDYECCVESAGSSFVALIGHCIDLRNPATGEAALARSLLQAAIQGGIDAMLAGTHDLLGRFVAICQIAGSWHVFGDACATRTIYFTEDRPAIASHSTLLGEMIGVAPRTDLFRHYWCALPGNASPVEGVRILPANFVLDLQTRQARRFWPLCQRVERPVSELADELYSALQAAATAVAARWRPALSLTAGLDSRLSLTACRSVGDLITFTYDRGAQDTVDVEVAARLSERLGIPHRRLLPVDRDRAAEAHALMERMVDCPIDKTIGPICLNGFRDGGRNTIHVRSSLAEIGRAFWRYHHPDMPTRMDPGNWIRVSLAKSASHLPGRAQAADYLHAEMRRFFAMMGYDSLDPRAPEILGYDAWDLAYMEHRMSTWHGPTLLAYDIEFDTTILFNCRRILDLMLSAPLSSRRHAELFRTIIARRCPELAGIPFNPKPPKSLRRLAYGAYRQLRRRLRFLPAFPAGPNR